MTIIQFLRQIKHTLQNPRGQWIDWGFQVLSWEIHGWGFAVKRTKFGRGQYLAWAVRGRPVSADDPIPEPMNRDVYFNFDNQLGACIRELENEVFSLPPDGR